MKILSILWLSIISLLVLIGCASGIKAETASLPQPTKYLEVSSGYVWDATDVGIDVCKNTSSHYCFDLPSSRIVTIPKSEEDTLALYNRVREGDGDAYWEKDGIKIFAYEIIREDILGTNGPYYKFVMFVGDTLDGVTYLDETVFSYRDGIILYMELSEGFLIDSKVNYPTSVFVPMSNN